MEAGPSWSRIRNVHGGARAGAPEGRGALDGAPEGSGAVVALPLDEHLHRRGREDRGAITFLFDLHRGEQQ